MTNEEIEEYYDRERANDPYAVLRQIHSHSGFWALRLGNIFVLNFYSQKYILTLGII